ncbi:putative Actin family, ATPase, nucleotide binding domain-containing protein [Helianthus annuus]|nr:putative Actin family, ATPase, nucleotide binding domain-containing protein [Helianthus annuus]
MLEDTWHIDFPRRPDVSDGLYSGINNPLQMWDNYPYMSNQQKKEDNIGLADTITKSILKLILLIRVTPCYIFAHFSFDLRLIGRIDLQRKLFCSMQLIGGVALTAGLISAVEERVLHAIPSNEAIDTVEILQSRSNPLFVAWRGGAVSRF